MTEDKNLKVGAKIDIEQMKKLNKTYKKLKKYMKSPIYEIKNLDGSETLVKGLLDEYGEDNDSQDTDTV